MSCSKKSEKNRAYGKSTPKEIFGQQNIFNLPLRPKIDDDFKLGLINDGYDYRSIVRYSVETSVRNNDLRIIGYKSNVSYCHGMSANNDKWVEGIFLNPNDAEETYEDYTDRLKMNEDYKKMKRTKFWSKYGLR